MRIGAIFPQIELGGDPHIARVYAQTVEQLGFDHVVTYEHVLGVDPNRPGGWNQPYGVDTVFHEPMVFLGYLAGITSTIELVTTVLILPQREAVLTAKQAAEIDVLSSGRLRLGVGLGSIEIEYRGLNQDFKTRSNRISEQIEVMRMLWCQRQVTFQGKYHVIDGAGIRPMPVQQPIPVWMGGAHPDAIRRIARIADGWFPQMPLDRAQPLLELLWERVAAEGRERNELGIEARAQARDLRSRQDIERFLEEWLTAGATHVGLNTMNAGFRSLDEHLEFIARFKEVATPYRGRNVDR